MKIQMKWLLLSLIIGWFLGAASGTLLTRFVRPGGPCDMHFGRARARFERKLKLTPEQRAQVDSILQANRQKLDAIFAETEPRVEAIRAGTEAQIRQLLTPEQQIRFDQIAARHNAKRKVRLEEARKNGPPLL